MSIQTARTRADRGARLLDAEIPGWASHINVDALDMGEMDVDCFDDVQAYGACILCQVDLAIGMNKLAVGGARRTPGLDDEEQLEDDLYMASLARAAGEDSGGNPDETDDEGPRTSGSYLALAGDLGLLGQGKIDHGFLTDANVTWAELDQAWKDEVADRV